MPNGQTRQKNDYDNKKLFYYIQIQMKVATSGH